MLGGLTLLLAAVPAGPASAAVGFDRVHTRDQRIGAELRPLFPGERLVRGLARACQGDRRRRRWIAVATDLRRGRRGRRVAHLVCTMMRDSRLWSAAPDHAVYGRNDVRLRSC